MSWTAPSAPGAIDLKTVIAELDRELALRRGVYAGWVDSGKMTADKASSQYGPLLKARQVVGWLDKVTPDRIKLALEVLAIVEARPNVFAEVAGSEALKALIEAFPGSKLVGIKPAGNPAETTAEAA